MTVPPAPRRQRSGVASVVIVLAFAVAIGGLVAAGRPSAPGAAISDYLPASPRTSLHADVATGEAWQVNQGVLPAASAWEELSLLARRHLEPIGEGHWLTVDLLDPARPAARLSLDLQVEAESVSLRTVTTPDRSLSLDPGIPVLDPTMLDGVELAWEGTLARDSDGPVSSTAQVSTRPLTEHEGCLETRVQLDEVAEMLTWCSGADAGLVGWQTETSASTTGFLPEPADRADVADAVDLDEQPPAALAAEPVRAVQFFRIVAGSYREQLAPHGSRTAWAGDQLVIADTEGRVTSWLPLDDDSPDSYYSQVWRAQPGGSIRGIIAVGAVTVLGTTEREVVGYDRDGWELWRAQVADGVTQVITHGGLVVVADASGTITVLDPETGVEQWSSTGATEIMSVGGDPGAVVVLAGSTLEVRDLATGALAWSVDVDPRATSAAATASQVAIATGSWLVVRTTLSGEVAWARAVPTDTLLYGTPDHLLVSGPRTAALVDTAGRTTWASERPMSLVLPLDDGTVLAVQADGLVVAGPSDADLVWAYPDGVDKPDLEPVRGDRGIVTVQLLDGAYRWWEYR